MRSHSRGEESKLYASFEDVGVIALILPWQDDVILKS